MTVLCLSACAGLNVRVAHGLSEDSGPAVYSQKAAGTNECNDGWLEGPPVNGVGGEVHAIARDSAGNVYVGGNFTAAGDKRVNNIAKWDGSSWSAMGSGSGSMVTAIVTLGSDVYAAGGYFDTADGRVNAVVKWDGAAWSRVGTGSPGGVVDLAVSGLTIYAVTSSSVHAWNGNTWSPVGPDFGSPARSIAVSGSDIYVGGNFERVNGVEQVLKWNGRTWTSLGSPFTGEFGDLAVSDSGLYAAGNDHTSQIGSVARWNGTTWTVLGQMMKPDGSPWVDIYSIAVAGTEVYVAGRFSTANDVQTPGAAKWDGSKWTAVGTWRGGRDEYLKTGQMLHSSSVSSIAVAGSDVYFGGTFFGAQGDLRADGIAKWNGSAWSALGSGRYEAPTAFTTSGSDIYAAGYFTADGGNTISRAAKWNGTGWTSLPPWTSPSPDRAYFVEAIAVSGVNVYVGGRWQQDVSTGPARGFVRHWNGSSWSDLGSGMTGPGLPYYGPSSVYALAVIGNDVYAGGSFDNAGGNPANMIAKWDGSKWSPLALGRTWPVYALAVSGNDLYVGGSLNCYFCTWDDTRIVKWDGTEWSAVGGFLEPVGKPSAPDMQYRAVSAITISGSDIYAVGGFDRSDYDDSGFISRWNGSQWSDVVFGGFLTAFAVSGSEIYSAGWFPYGIIKWDGSTDSSLGVDRESWRVTSLAIAGGQLFVADKFNYTAGCHVSAHSARYSLGQQVSVSGRVLTATGAPIRNAVVTITDPFGATRSTITSTFGNYSFDNVGAGQTYTLRASAKRFRFDPKTVAITDYINDLDLIANTFE